MEIIKVEYIVDVLGVTLFYSDGSSFFLEDIFTPSNELSRYSEWLKHNKPTAI